MLTLCVLWLYVYFAIVNLFKKSFKTIPNHKKRQLLELKDTAEATYCDHSQALNYNKYPN